jgi:hypothetical protein
MKVCAILENQWFKNPARMEEIRAKHYAGNRSEFIRTFLFFGCLTGKRIQSAFGDRWTDPDAIVWEETSPRMASSPSEKFPPDVDHVRAFLARERPDVVLTFGKPALRVTLGLQAEATDAKLDFAADRHVRYFKIIEAPHPAARHATVCEELVAAAETLNQQAAIYAGKV